MNSGADKRADLLIEIGTEELPARFVNPLAKTFLETIKDSLDKQLGGTKNARGVAECFATPRRITVLVKDVLLQQQDQTIERRGPAVAAAFDDAGNPSPAAQGFAKSCGVEVGDLQRVATDKGEYLVHRAVQPGQPTVELIPEMFDDALAMTSFGTKLMRWGAGTASFVRPVQWVVAMLDNEIVPLERFGVTAGNVTYGHRFHAPDPIEIMAPRNYEQQLEEAYVLADLTKRRMRVHKLVLAAANELGGKAILDEGLLDEVTALVEWPVALAGHFDERFLELPEAVLRATLEHHQRCFAVAGDDDRLLPAFITVANLESRDPEQVRTGNERVIRPRLTDAMFFWERDRRKSLEEFAAGLADVAYVKELGSLADKMDRVTSLALKIREATNAEIAKIDRATKLARADLLTDMVFEFTELQGVMGRHYALASGEDPEVAQAIDEQYMPRFAGDTLPATPTGRTLALADKLDTLAGIFAIGNRPSGNRDPYALRRAALGVLRILVESEISLDLRTLITEAVFHQPVPADAAEVETALLDFMIERARGYFAEQGVSAEVFESVRATGVIDTLDMARRIRAVQTFLGRPEAEALAAAHKRVRNILKGEDATGEPQEALLEEEAEAALFHNMVALENHVDEQLATRDYPAVLAQLAALKAPVDRFFDQVMVMAEDKAKRRNRLALLNKLDTLCRSVADLSELPG